MKAYAAAFQQFRLQDPVRIERWKERFLDAARDLKSRGICLDVGCGVGRFTKPLTSHFDYVIGLDSDSEMLGFASQNLPANISLIAADATRLPLDDCSVDMIVASMVMEHVPNKAQFIAELARVLNQTGVIILRTMLPEDIDRTTWYQFLPKARELELIRTLSFDEVERLAEESGLVCHMVSNIQEYVGRDVFLDPLWVRIQNRAYQILSELSSEEIEAGHVAARRQLEDVGGEVLSSSLMTLRK